MSLASGAIRSKHGSTLNTVPNRGADHKPRDAHRDDDEQCFWPLDLIPNDFPNARVLIFGYKSALGSTSTGLSDLGHQLLDSLSDIRTSCLKRPLIFVGHSLGGLVIKSALLSSSQQLESPSAHSIFKSTYSIIFFGTPHRGASVSQLSRILANISRAAAISVANEKVLGKIRQGGWAVKELSEDFSTICNDGNIQLCSLQERRPTGAIGMVSNGRRIHECYS